MRGGPGYEGEAVAVRVRCRLAGSGIWCFCCLRWGLRDALLHRSSAGRMRGGGLDLIAGGYEGWWGEVLDWAVGRLITHGMACRVLIRVDSATMVEP
jgi:hypothetical protein